MAKVKKGKAIQMLSPENYIRKKARTLPIFECLIQVDWEVTKLTTVVIARSHVNGNITACTYLVDLDCLGVKDSMFLFNIPITKYKEFKETIGLGLGLDKVDYPLAHNIILAGVEFAAEFGFKPYKDYESVTKYMLEEDTEDIQLIEIECGEDGKPLYVQGPFEDDTKAKQIIAQLEKNVGPGNYKFILNIGDKSMDEYEEDDLEDEDEFDDMTFAEKKELFLTLYEKFDHLKKEELKTVITLTNSMVEDLVDLEKVNQFYNQYWEELNVVLEVDKIPDQLLGIKPGVQTVSEELKTRFLQLHRLASNNLELAHKEMKLFKEESNGVPAAYFIELILLQTEKSPLYAKRLKKYAQAYPDYALIQLLWVIEQLTSMEDPKKIPGFPFSLKTFFPDRDSLYPMEWLYALIVYSLATGAGMDINKIEAFGSVIDDFDLPDSSLQLLVPIISIMKFNYLLLNMNEWILK